MALLDLIGVNDPGFDALLAERLAVGSDVWKKTLQAGLSEAFWRSMQAVMRFTSGISELQSRNASGVHAASSSDEAAFPGVDRMATVSAMTTVSLTAMGGLSGEKITRVLLGRNREAKVRLCALRSLNSVLGKFVLETNYPVR